MIENYVLYLNFIQEKLDRFFASQKPYIFCKRGCGECCKHAQFPYSQIEATYLMHGASKLDNETADIVMENVKNILEAKNNFKGDLKNFDYDCPFLINNECCVYEYRGLICRSFGLMEYVEGGGVNIPFCYRLGLNYSNVIDHKTETGKPRVSAERFKELGVKEEPSGFNTNYKFLTDEDFAKGFHFEFGEKKPLIQWFENK